MTVISAPLAPGAQAPAMEWVVSQDVIDRYADATGDHNPIHVDPDYSAKGPFGGTIAHGLMTLAYAAQVLNAWTDGAFDQVGEIEVAFVGPVFVGEQIRITAEVESVDADSVAHCGLLCMAGERKILVGKVHLPVTPQEGEAHGA